MFIVCDDLLLCRESGTQSSVILSDYEWWRTDDWLHNQVFDDLRRIDLRRSEGHNGFKAVAAHFRSGVVFIYLQQYLLFVGAGYLAMSRLFVNLFGLSACVVVCQHVCPASGECICLVLL